MNTHARPSPVGGRIVGRRERAARPLKSQEIFEISGNNGSLRDNGNLGMLPSISVLMDSSGRNGRSSSAGWLGLVEGGSPIKRGMYLQTSTLPNTAPPKRLNALDSSFLGKGSSAHEITEGRTNLTKKNDSQLSPAQLGNQSKTNFKSNRTESDVQIAHELPAPNPKKLIDSLRLTTYPEIGTLLFRISL